MKVLVIGGGGREHALAWKIKQSPRVDEVFVAPGNAGTALDAVNVSIGANDIAELVKFAKTENIGLTVVGPEAPLALGIVDAFESEKLRVFGPTQVAAQLESSKAFCKNLLRQADVPTADFQVFRDPDDAMRFIKGRFPGERDRCPVVVKADGLAAGKGVIVCKRRNDALEAIDRISRRKEFGAAGMQMLIEERLDGQEASVLAITDGRTILPLPAAQDHKPAFDGDTGPNTGGMGAYSPTPIVDDALMAWIEEHVLVPTVHTMKRNRKPFRGVLYAGLMLTPQAGPKVLEYNCRFGDPECQPLLMRLKSDIMDILEGTVDQTLDQIDTPQWDPRPGICVVMASQGYPGDYEKGRPITGIDAADALEDVKVFHAGTRLDGDTIVNDGGRVLGVTALGDTISKAKLNAYTAVQKIRWAGAWCRKDISDKALQYLADQAKVL
ncbi:phosphoribosylamine--glycine ligase [Aureliella helgolandensis]|uniref:Phosphoribosylamine--glycine ligase n=1 Tax=Aureliella helgolandensis TaxID=2527968 RepID=A0A518GHG1_9BACT|nr:phosphoribosylamine--glycine ligase [Aureliella helgolandensis]QDV28035.1 Phosphoribosylamine--glycine ligase [Aureliella helgolandensis]